MAKTIKSKHGLTPPQQKFADEWLVDYNGLRAYKVAYPSVKKDETAKTAASRLLTNVNVKAYIEARRAETSAKYSITQERLLEEESCIAYSNIAEIFKHGVNVSPDKLPENLQRAISAIEIKDLGDGKYEYKYRFWDKGRALERMEKHLGMFEKDNAQKRLSIEEAFEALESIDSNLTDKIKEKLTNATS